MYIPYSGKLIFWKEKIGKFPKIMIVSENNFPKVQCCCCAQTCFSSCSLDFQNFISEMSLDGKVLPSENFPLATVYICIITYSYR